MAFSCVYVCVREIYVYIFEREEEDWEEEEKKRLLKAYKNGDGNVDQLKASNRFKYVGEAPRRSLHCLSEFKS